MCYHIEHEIHENMDERMSVDISQYPLVECSTSSKLHYIVSGHSNEFVGDMWQALRVVIHSRSRFCGLRAMFVYSDCICWFICWWPPQKSGIFGFTVWKMQNMLKTPKAFEWLAVHFVGSLVDTAELRVPFTLFFGFIFQ